MDIPVKWTTTQISNAKGDRKLTFLLVIFQTLQKITDMPYLGKICKASLLAFELSWATHFTLDSLYLLLVFFCKFHESFLLKPIKAQVKDSGLIRPKHSP
jgi:hypothetical protein